MGTWMYPYALLSLHLCLNPSTIKSQKKERNRQKKGSIGLAPAEYQTPCSFVIQSCLAFYFWWNRPANTDSKDYIFSPFWQVILPWETQVLNSKWNGTECTQIHLSCCPLWGRVCKCIQTLSEELLVVMKRGLWVRMAGQARTRSTCRSPHTEGAFSATKWFN